MVEPFLKTFLEFIVTRITQHKALPNFQMKKVQFCLITGSRRHDPVILNGEPSLEDKLELANQES